MKHGALALISLALTGSAFNLGMQKPDSANPNHQVFEVRLSIRAMLDEVAIRHGISKQWRLYDRQGRQVGEVGDVGPTKQDAEQFRGSLSAILQAPEVVGSRTLSWELTLLEDKNGRPLQKIRDADFTIIKYWIKSCEQCRIIDQSEAKVVHEVLGSFKSLTINIVNVDADVVERANEQKQH